MALLLVTFCRYASMQSNHLEDIAAERHVPPTSPATVGAAFLSQNMADSRLKFNSIFLRIERKVS